MRLSGFALFFLIKSLATPWSGDIRKKDKPKVSLGIPIFNESKYISETVNSLINQTYENIEIIAIDNDSNDDSFRILESLSKQEDRLKIFKNTKNIGMSENFNLVFKKSTGKYFAWIDYIGKEIPEYYDEDDDSILFYSDYDNDSDISYSK